VVDAQGRVLKANAEARRLAGKPLPGETCRQFWRCRVEPGRCPLRRALRLGRPVRRAKVAQGGPHACAIERISVFRDEAGRRRAVILTGPATSYFKRLESLRHEARIDGLTRVLNRHGFDELTARAVHGDRRRRPAAFLMLDIDGLKKVNDRFGHEAGDGLIARLGAVLAACARREDVVGRVGGDEFAVYCARTRHADARALVRRIGRAIRDDNAAHDSEPALSAQIGLACSAGGRNGTLRATADRGLLRRKLAMRGSRLERKVGGAL
jgi:diguanylate cyclase (GGDEF)-like protein